MKTCAFYCENCHKLLRYDIHIDKTIRVPIHTLYVFIQYNCLFFFRLLMLPYYAYFLSIGLQACWCRALWRVGLKVTPFSIMTRQSAPQNSICSRRWILRTSTYEHICAFYCENCRKFLRYDIHIDKMIHVPIYTLYVCNVFIRYNYLFFSFTDASILCLFPEYRAGLEACSRRALWRVDFESNCFQHYESPERATR